MNSTLIKRMQGLWVALVVVLAVGAVGATAASAAAPSAQISGLNAKQKKAKKKALKKCKKIKKAKKRKACIKKVKKKYKKLANKNKNKKGKTYTVDVGKGGDYYVPSLVKLKVNDSIKWDWKFSVSSEGHNVSLASGPAGVSPFDFESPIFKGPNDVFKRKFKKPGNYSLFCTLHTLMRMDVQVKK